MLRETASALPELIHSLEGQVRGEFRTDFATRLLYSTDASIYKITPMGVFFPANTDELNACVEAAYQFKVPILARGSGSSLAGQAVGPGLIIDCSRHLNQVNEINAEQKYAKVEPGVILSILNESLAADNLQFGPDPASAERATIGGVIANNATGAHSIRYGMTADNLIDLDLVLSDGSRCEFKQVDNAEIQRNARRDDREGEIYRAVLEIKKSYSDDIMQNWPGTWRQSSGYNLNYLLPWSPSAPQLWSKMGEGNTIETAEYPPPGFGKTNLASLIAGSEGTLAIIRQVTLRLVPKPKYTVLAILAYPSIGSACDAIGEILEFNPSAIELIPANMINLARNVPAYAHQLQSIDSLFGAHIRVPNLLAIEFEGDDQLAIKELAERVIKKHAATSILAEDRDQQEEIWNVRKVGLGLLMSNPGDFKPIAFIEDISVPVERLSEFVREMEVLLKSFDTQGDFYAHASVGCLHLRPLVNIKSVDGVARMREIAFEAMNIVAQLGGVPSGEHGDGLARSEWLPRIFGTRIYSAFRELKRAADPDNLLNPGKIVDPPRMDENLRYKTNLTQEPWQTRLDFSTQGSLLGAVELCNGAGVCRKLDGLMCPSFQVTSEEMHSTRGRANLLRELFSGDLSLDQQLDQNVVFNALDLCLACKGCKAECPSAVDMAKLKSEFLNWYYQQSGNRRHVRDYLFGYIEEFSRIGSTFKPGSNYLLKMIHGDRIGERWLGVSQKRKLPNLAESSFHSLMTKFNQGLDKSPTPERVLFLCDPFTEYYQPETGAAAVNVLGEAGCQVEHIPVTGSGRTLISKGFLKSARSQAKKVIQAIVELDPENEAFIVGIEPSEIYTLRDEYLALLPGDSNVVSIAGRSLMIDEFLVRPGKEGERRIMRIVDKRNNGNVHLKDVLLHGHCFQKVQPPGEDGFPTGVHATRWMLEAVGYNVELINAGCCGMAGAFGYEAEHYDLSMSIGELALFPRVRQANDEVVIAAPGFSCMTQIKDGTGRRAVHPIELLEAR